MNLLPLVVITSLNLDGNENGSENLRLERAKMCLPPHRETDKDQEMLIFCVSPKTPS